MTKSIFWLISPFQNFKVVARADLLVYNAENFCVSIFNQVASIFHFGEGKIKKCFLGLIAENLGDMSES